MAIAQPPFKTCRIYERYDDGVGKSAEDIAAARYLRAQLPSCYRRGQRGVHMSCEQQAQSRWTRQTHRPR